MRIRVWMLLALTVFSSPALLSAEEPPKTPPTWTVGSVYANMSHTVIDEKALESPWFLEDGNWRIEADGRAAP